MSDYDFVSGGSLKLKNTTSTSTNGFDKKGKKKRGTKKTKYQGNSGQRELVEEAPIDSTSTNSGNEQNSGKRKNDPSKDGDAPQDGWMTEAQKKFKKQQDKFQMARIISKATKSHKQRVEEFNAHLEGLSEHYDIPKVSWTKWTQCLLEGCSISYTNCTIIYVNLYLHYIWKQLILCASLNMQSTALIKR